MGKRRSFLSFWRRNTIFFPMHAHMYIHVSWRRDHRSPLGPEELGSTSPVPASAKTLRAGSGSGRWLEEHQCVKHSQGVKLLLIKFMHMQVRKQNSGCSGKPSVGNSNHWTMPAIAPEPPPASARMYWITSLGAVGSPEALLKTETVI